MYMLRSLSLVLATCASLVVTGPPPLPENMEKQVNTWKYLSPGDSFNLNPDEAIQSPGVFTTYMFFTDTNATLVQNCQIKLPCNNDASFKIVNSSNLIIGYFCSKKDDVLTQLSIMRSTYYLINYVRTGSASGSNFTCTIKSLSLKCNCGKKITSRIAGGTEAAINEIPWQAALVKKAKPTEVYCGAAVVSELYLVTAALCAHPTDTKIIQAIYGVISVTASTPVDVESILRHPEHNVITYENDISLIKLAKRLAFSSSISPVCLPTPLQSESLVDKSLQISGWGGTICSGAPSPILRKLTVTGQTNSPCTTIYEGTIPESMLCTYQKRSGICFEDKGGPLTYTSSGVTYLVGVPVLGIRNINSDSWTLHTRITKYLDWIGKNMDDIICSP